MICKVEGCPRDAVARGLCLKDYKRWKRGREPGDPFTKTANPNLAGYERKPGTRVCSIEGCSEHALSRGLCNLHYGRLRRHGHPLAGGALRPLRANWQKGLSKHPLYATWSGMKARCNNPREAAYKNYGARGIAVDQRWDDFGRFLADMGERPSPQHSIDRIDNDGNYSPENCRWATHQEQVANRRPLRGTLPWLLRFNAAIEVAEAPLAVI